MAAPPQADPESRAVELVADFNDGEAPPVEKILIREVNPELYSCQFWRVGERDPDFFYINIP